MRRRVLLATVSAVTVAVVLLGIPLAIQWANWIGVTEMRDLDSRAAGLERAVEQRMSRGAEINELVLAPYVEGVGSIAAYVVVLTPVGERYTAGEPITGETITFNRTTESGASVIIEASKREMQQRSWQAIAIVIAGAVVAITAGIMMSVWQANRLAAPLVLLAAQAEQLGAGQVRPNVKPSGVEEIDLVASELARSADRLALRLAAERQFAGDASHQLRTPLTALSMRLEEIMLTSDQPAIREEARISLEQVERLVNVVDDLLTRSKRSQGGTTEPVQLNEVLAQQAEEWQPAFAEAGRDLDIEVPEGISVLVTPGALAQVIATLVENSLKHGGGTTKIRLRSRSETSSGTVVIEVSDEGDGVPAELAGRIFERSVTSGRGTGLGLALARDLVTADGGRLELAQRVPAGFAVFLAEAPKQYGTEEILLAGLEADEENQKRRTPW